MAWARMWGEGRGAWPAVSWRLPGRGLGDVAAVYPTDIPDHHNNRRCLVLTGAAKPPQTRSRRPEWIELFGSFLERRTDRRGQRVINIPGIGLWSPPDEADDRIAVADE